MEKKDKLENLGEISNSSRQQSDRQASFLAASCRQGSQCDGGPGRSQGLGHGLCNEAKYFMSQTGHRAQMHTLPYTREVRE